MRGNCKIATGISPEYGGISRHYQIGRSEAARDTSCW